MTEKQLANLEKGRGRNAHTWTKANHPPGRLNGAEDGRPWQKGCPSPNPGGTRGPQLKRKMLQELYEKKVSEWPQKGEGSASQDLALTLLKKAIDEGDMVAIKEVLNRMEGPVTTKTDITTGGQPFKALIGVDIDDI